MKSRQQQNFKLSGNRLRNTQLSQYSDLFSVAEVHAKNGTNQFFNIEIEQEQVLITIHMFSSLCGKKKSYMFGICGKCINQ